jgi:hypothetical protein
MWLKNPVEMKKILEDKIEKIRLKKIKKKQSKRWETF